MVYRFLRQKRHYGNQDMLKFLKKNGIDVVPYPESFSTRPCSTLNYWLLTVKSDIGWYELGTHSAANCDACVALETINSRKPSEIDNFNYGAF